VQGGTAAGFVFLAAVVPFATACGRIGYDALDAAVDAVDARVDAATERSMTLEIAEDLDDGELETSRGFGVGGFAPQGERNSWIYMGGYDSSLISGEGLTVSYFRFRLDEAIPAGSRIVEARMRLFARDVWEWEPSSDHVWIAAEDARSTTQPTRVEDAPTLATGRPITARVRWPAEGELAWPLDEWHETGDVAPCVQQLVDTYGGLAAGAYVTVYVFRDGGATHGELACEDWSHPDTNHARLRLRWR
jgi:hypothetical protein